MTANNNKPLTGRGRHQVYYICLKLRSGK